MGRVRLFLGCSRFGRRRLGLGFGWGVFRCLRLLCGVLGGILFGVIGCSLLVFFVWALLGFGGFIFGIVSGLCCGVFSRLCRGLRNC